MDADMLNRKYLAVVLRIIQSDQSFIASHLSDVAALFPLSDRITSGRAEAVEQIRSVVKKWVISKELALEMLDLANEIERSAG